MRRFIRHLVPSMFQRRLWLLLIAAFATSGVMAYQMTRLTLVRGAALRREAEGALTEGSLIPTIRGRILDRKMRVLAVDRPSYDITVKYHVITGQWAYLVARRDAIRANKSRWIELGYDEREKLISQYQRRYDTQVESMLQELCQVGGISRAELQERMDEIRGKVQQISSSMMLRLWSKENQRRLAELEEPVTLGEVAQEVEEQRAAHELLTAIDSRAVLRVQRMIGHADEPDMEVWNQVTVEPSRERDYPRETIHLAIDRSSFPNDGELRSEQPLEMNVEGVGMQLLGLMRGVWKEDVKLRSFAFENERGEQEIDLRGYLPGDQVGALGIEKAQEDILRGARGREVRWLDSSRRERQDPLPGGDVVVSIDSQLQARIQGIMDPALGLMKVQKWHSKDLAPNPLKPHKPKLGDPLNGAAVVLDIATGEVLAAVSMPSLKLSQLRQAPQEVWKDQREKPYLNRVIAEAYQPGSTVKPLVLSAAITDRKLAYDETITCDGHFYPNDPNHFRCWIYKSFNQTHGPLTGPEAIEKSCNIFFHTLGQRLGAQRLVWWYDRFNLGRATGCGLEEEIGGSLPDLARANSPTTQGFSAEDALYMGIGQGPITWTPLQAANAYATLARGGRRLMPTFVQIPQRVDRAGEDLGLDPKAVELACRGLFGSVNEHEGTSNNLTRLGHELTFNLPGVRIIGKSGTADAAPLRIDSDEDGKITTKDQIVREGDHAWSIVMVQKPGSPRPDYVVVVVVEFGGSGGNVAGPVANQILHAMRQEGYL